MSFILDALKKSESDRQQQSGTEFAGVPTSRQTPSVPRWLLVVGLLLAVNLAVLVGLLLRPDTTPTVQTSDTSTTIPPVTRDTPQPSFESQVATAKMRAPGQQVEEFLAEPVTNTIEAVHPLLISQNPSSIPSEDIFPTIHEVIANGLISLPPLHLDIHVYSTEPEDRFVFINMAKLREGSQLDEGPAVAEITPDGVVLRHQGHIFLLPRD